MEFNTQPLNDVQAGLIAGKTKLHDVYDGLDWADEVYSSFEQFVDDMGGSADKIIEALQNAGSVVAGLSDINVNEIEQEFASICSE